MSGTLGLLLGTAAALARTSGHAWLYLPARFYLWIIRGTPLLVQVLFA